MTDRELMQEALYALTYVGDKEIYSDIIDALRARLAQPEPQREWVGLTDEEIDKWNIVGHESLREFVRSIEAKLKEQNRY